MVAQWLVNVILLTKGIVLVHGEVDLKDLFSEQFSLSSWLCAEFVGGPEFDESDAALLYQPAT